MGVTTRPPVSRRGQQVIAYAVTVAWFLSVLARMANPERYPIPAEVHYLMGAVITATFGAAVWSPRRDIPPPPAPRTTPHDDPRSDDA